jgi:hypothetical protein
VLSHFSDVDPRSWVGSKCWTATSVEGYIGFPISLTDPSKVAARSSSWNPFRD